MNQSKAAKGCDDEQKGRERHWHVSSMEFAFATHVGLRKSQVFGDPEFADGRNWARREPE